MTTILDRLDVKGGPLMGAFTILVLAGGAAAVALRLSGRLPGADLPEGLVRCYQAAVVAYAGSRTFGPYFRGPV